MLRFLNVRKKTQMPQNLNIDRKIKETTSDTISSITTIIHYNFDSFNQTNQKKIFIATP